MNLRPSGYEPDELPGCSIPRQPAPARDTASRCETPQARSAGRHLAGTAPRADARTGAWGADKVNGFFLDRTDS